MSLGFHITGRIHEPDRLVEKASDGRTGSRLVGRRAGAGTLADGGGSEMI